MAANQAQAPAGKTLQDRELKERLQELRRTDNVTNWLYLGRVYLVIALAVTAVIATHHGLTAWGLSWWWNVPVVLAAVVVIGASQHQLGGATHEATHYILFKDRRLNELASDWLCMFPLFSSTYVFRLHHLAHHQFINDPERDPDFSQLKLSGHWLAFPVSKFRFLRFLLAQWWLLPLVRYILVRALYNSVGVTNNPYAYRDRTFSQWPPRVGLVYFFVLFPLMWYLSARGVDPLWLAVVPAVGLALVAGYYLAVPAERFPVARPHPVFSPRGTLMQRAVHSTLLIAGLTGTQYLTGAPVWAYFLLLWLVPMFTTFSFFMILRQLVQHGNGDRGWLTNTRTFLVHPFIRYAVFPFGMDYHLPHHMFATIPHYRLPELHDLLMGYPEYAGEGVVVEGYFFPKHDGPGRPPTVLEVLGPDYVRDGDEVFIDDSVVAASPPPHPLGQGDPPGSPPGQAGHAA